MSSIWPAFPLSFINLWALAFLIFVPIIILLYFLKLKRPQIRMSSTLLWQKVIEDMRVNSPFQRLRKSLLLLLQLLLLLLLVFALARPWLKSLAAKEESLIVLLDVSASMQTVEANGETRLEQAKGEIEKIVRDLSYRSEMAIITFDSRSQTAAPFTSNRKRLLRALREAEATDGTTNPVNAFRKAKSLGGSRTNPRILLFSDGSFSDPGEVGLPIEVHMTGTVRPNVGITEIDIRRSLKDPKNAELFFSVQNFSDTKVSGTITIEIDGQMLDSKALEMPPKSNWPRIFEGPMPGDGVLRVKVEVDDALAVDNEAQLIIPKAVPRRILVVGNNTYYVEKALGTSADIKLTSIALKDYAAHKDKGYTTVVWCNVVKPDLALANNIYLGCAPKVDGLEVGEVIKNPNVADWDNSHPLVRFIDFSNLKIAETLDLKFPEDAQVVLKGGDGPLIGLMVRKGSAIVVTGFNVFRSSWPFQVSFVLFMHNCLKHFDELQATSGNANLRVGAVLTAPAQAKAPMVKLPDGSIQEMARIAGGGYSFSGVTQSGVYEIRNLERDGTRKLSANLLSSEESELTPIENPITIDGDNVRRVKAAKISREYFRTLLIVALFILLVEWIVYHRRFLN